MTASATGSPAPPQFRPPRYRSPTAFNLGELLLWLVLAVFALVFLALPWLVLLDKGLTFWWVLFALGIDVAMVLFMWGIFGIGLWLATKRPRRGTERISRDALRERLLNLNDEQSIFVLAEVAPFHLAGRWKLDNPHYYSLLGKHGLHELYQLDLFLKPDGPVAALETRGSIRWNMSAAPPRARYAWSFFRGIVLFEYKMEKAWALDRSLRFRKVADFTFNPDEYKRPIIELIVGSGWVFRPVLFRPLNWRGD